MKSKLLPFLIFLPLIFNLSTYNFHFGFGYLICDDDISCLHEIGHKMDTDLDHPSRSLTFADAIRLYLLAHWTILEPDEITNMIMVHSGIFIYDDMYSFGGVQMFSSPQEELYANIYTLVNGDISKLHPSLQQFYSNDLEYQDLYSCLIEKRVCNHALRIR